MKFLGLMEWVFGNSLGRGGRSFLDVLVSRRVMVLRLVFSIMCGVENSSLRHHLWSCISFLALGMLLWPIVFSFLKSNGIP
jgi:hypothetical protein